MLWGVLHVLWGWEEEGRIDEQTRTKQCIEESQLLGLYPALGRPSALDIGGGTGLDVFGSCRKAETHLNSRFRKLSVGVEIRR